MAEARPTGHEPSPTAIPSSDEVLLAALADGEPMGAAAFVDRFQGPCFAIAVAVLTERADAEEVVQQAFVNAWRRAASFDPSRGPVAAWMAVITRNLAIDHLRRRRPVLTDPAVLAANERPSPGNGPEESAVLRVGADQVHAALAELPDQQRRAVLLAAWHGRTAQEVADLEAIPLGTAKTRIRTGLRRLRATLATAGDPRAAPAPGPGPPGEAEEEGRVG
jgi:RNA polymerase sigma factor (sigma-70 family)